MSEVKRYDMPDCLQDAYLDQHDAGGYVLHSDYLTLEQERDELKEQLAAIKLADVRGESYLLVKKFKELLTQDNAVSDGENK